MKYKLYPYIDEKSIKVDEATISSDGVILQPIHGYYNASKKYVVNFYGLEYGKTYTLTIKSGKFIGIKTFTYQYDDNNFDKLEISIVLEENKSEGKGPEETKPEENKPEEKDSEEGKTEKETDIDKDATMAVSLLPETGKDDSINKLISICIIVSIIEISGLIIINHTDKGKISSKRTEK